MDTMYDSLFIDTIVVDSTDTVATTIDTAKKDTSYTFGLDTTWVKRTVHWVEYDSAYIIDDLDTSYDITVTGDTSYGPSFNDTLYEKVYELIADSAKMNVFLSWTQPADLDTDSLYQYFIYRGTRPADLGSLDFVTGVIDTIETATDVNYDIIQSPPTTYTDVDIVPQPVADITYYYQVAAVKLNWYEGKKSNIDSILIPHMVIDTTSQ
jgi:hypothetical protein